MFSLVIIIVILLFIFCYRHMPHEPPNYPTCNHNGKTFRCGRLKMCDINDFHKSFYCSYNKIVQDQFLLKYMDVRKPLRSRKRKGGPGKNFTVKYFVRVSGTKNFTLQVCKNAFINILHVSGDRLRILANKFALYGSVPLKENRGGQRIQEVNVSKRQSVKRFIENLKCTETHYCRGKSCRQYLPSELSIAKLLKMYNTSTDPDLQVRRSFFRNIFNRNYNVGFGTPVTDACSRCIELTEQIKHTTNVADKSRLLIDKRVHKLRANAFYALLKENKEDVLTLSYDCQKNLPIPKTPDQITYYSRQLYTYNFTVVKGPSQSKMNRDNVFCFTWMEHEFHKSSNEIASAVFHTLSTYCDLSKYSKIRLFADGCGGQNRNSTMIGMCIYFLENKAPLNMNEIELIFPVTGHSFLPSDRVFGRIEKKIKKISTITNPENYLDIFRENGTVIELKNCDVRDWKQCVKECLKTPGKWHFKFSTTKRFTIKKVRNMISVTGERFYRSNEYESGKSIFKQGKKVTHMNPQIIQKGVPINPKKYNDVIKLLTKHFGENWADLSDCIWFKNFVNDYSINNRCNDYQQDEEFTEENDFCEEKPPEEEEFLRI